MKKCFVGGLAFGVLMASIGISQDKAAVETPSPPAVTKDQPMSFWMEKKLEYSKDILAALAAGEFVEIERYAERMRLVGKIEGFVRGRSPSYATHLESFDLATRELKRQAHAESIEGATLAFNQLTTSCVTCHQTIREAARNRTAP